MYRLRVEYESGPIASVPLGETIEEALAELAVRMEDAARYDNVKYWTIYPPNP